MSFTLPVLASTFCVTATSIVLSASFWLLIMSFFDASTSVRLLMDFLCSAVSLMSVALSTCNDASSSFSVWLSSGHILGAAHSWHTSHVVQD